VDAGTVLGYVGLVGLVPVVGSWAAAATRWTRVSRVLGLGRTTPLDVVVTTSDSAMHPSGTSHSFRTNVGEVRAMASIAGALGAHYRRKQLRVHMSADISHRLNSDVVVLGGPLLNDTAADFMAAFARRYPESGLLHDAGGQRLTVGDFHTGQFDLERHEGVPGRDLVLVLLGRDLFAQGTRDILCCGFTTYGTAAAAELLFTDLLSKQCRALSRGLRGADGAAVVGTVRVVGKQLAHLQTEHVFRFTGRATGSLVGDSSDGRRQPAG
jgi:hypothetical protein